MFLPTLVAAAHAAEPAPPSDPALADTPTAATAPQPKRSDSATQFADIRAATAPAVVGGALVLGVEVVSGAIFLGSGSLTCNRSFMGRDTCPDTGIAPVVWFYSNIATFLAAGGAIALESASRRLLAQPPPPLGFVFAAAGTAVALGGYVGMALDGSAEPGAAEIAAVGGPALMVGGVALQFALDQAAAKHGFREDRRAALAVALVPAGNGLALAGSF